MLLQDCENSLFCATIVEIYLRNGKTRCGVHFTQFRRPFLEHDRFITLWFFLVESWEGEPWGKEGQPGQWIAQNALVATDFPPANEPVISKLQQG